MTLDCVTSSTTEKFLVNFSVGYANFSCIIKHKRDRSGSNPPKTTIKWKQEMPKKGLKKLEDSILDNFFSVHYPAWEKECYSDIKVKYKNSYQKKSNGKIYSTTEDIL